MNCQAFVRHVTRIVVHAAVWSLVWGVLIFIVGNVILQIDPDSIDPGEEPIRMVGMVAPVGAVGGMIFGLLLGLLERGRSFADVPVWQSLVLAALAGAAPPLLTTMNNSIALNTIPMGVIAAALSIGVARWRRRKAPTLSQRLASSA